MGRFGTFLGCHSLIVVLVAAGAEPPNQRPMSRGPFAQFPQMKPVLGTHAPDFELTDLKGREMRLKNLIGKKPIVIEFGSYT
jgi:hypothetical protein